MQDYNHLELYCNLFIIAPHFGFNPNQQILNYAHEFTPTYAVSYGNYELECLRMYPPSKKQMCIWLDSKGFSQQTIATLLSISQPSVSYHLSTRQKAKPYHCHAIDAYAASKRRDLLQTVGIKPSPADAHNLESTQFFANKQQKRMRDSEKRHVRYIIKK